MKPEKPKKLKNVIFTGIYISYFIAVKDLGSGFIVK